jgi:4'-phosphopantetheinyl transferase
MYNPQTHTLGISTTFPAQVGLDEVCVWWASLDQIACDCDRMEQHLSADEQERAGRFIFERDRSRYVAGRAVLRMILGRYLAVHPAEVSFCYGRYGKPLVEGTDLSFNMSKSAGYAVYAVTRNRRIGVDVEQIREIAEIEQIGRQFFSEPEYELLCARPRSMKQKTFFECWTRKEALVKSVGVGLTRPLHSFDVAENPEDSVRMVRLESDAGEKCPWTICDLEQYPGFAVAVAVESPCALPLRTHLFPSFD